MRSRWIWGVVVVATVVVLTILRLTSAGIDSEALRGMAVREPLPVRVEIQPADPGSFDAAWFEGLDRYRDADYGGAIGAFRLALSRQDDREVQLYLASAHFLRGEQQLAREVLQNAHVPGSTDRISQETLWQLVQVELSAGNLAGARDALERLEVALGPYRSKARSLLLTLDELE